MKRKHFSLRSWSGLKPIAGMMLLVGTASCVPVAIARQESRPLVEVALATPDLHQAQPAAADPAAIAPESLALQPVSPLDAEAINAGIPVTSGPNPRPASIVFRAATSWDQQRSLQCLAEAVYYEARSQSEDGQRAVAQVVLNRVLHPAYPNSVCGVVYQGPARAGGGCQFTFTCDGSLSVAPAGLAWERARRIAAEALAGSVYAPVGLATHYHTQEVVPVWAFRLVKSAVIGAHSFYRLPGAWGEPAAFRSAYAGREPAPAVLLAARPATTVPMLPALATTTSGGLVLPTQQNYAALAAAPKLDAPKLRDDRLPDSEVRAEYRSSGQWLDSASTH